MNSNPLLSYFSTLRRLHSQCEGQDGNEFPKVDATGVRVYVLDTGLNHNHADFVGMVGPESCWDDQINENSFPNTADGHGHGTHVSSTTVGLTYGVATGAELCPVKVLSSGGSGSGAGVMAGIDFVAENCNDPATNPDGKRCVANMSLGGGFLQAENDAVNAAVASGVVFVVAAGNDAGDACLYSPASAADAITVGSTTITDSMSGFSNYGSCMDIWAPGSNIKAAWIGSNTATNTISGTSMASPRKFFFLVFIIFVISPISNLATNQRVYCSLSLYSCSFPFLRCCRSCCRNFWRRSQPYPRSSHSEDPS